MLSELSNRGEFAVTRINLMHARIVQLAALDHEEIEHHEQVGVLMHPFAISIVEDLSTTWLLSLMKDRSKKEPVGSLLWIDQKRRKTESWRERFKTWKTFLGVDHQNFEHIADLWTHIEIRNALAHGAGSLTDRQLSNTHLLRDLPDVGVEVSPTWRLKISSEATAHLARTAISYAIWIDTEAQRVGE